MPLRAQQLRKQRGEQCHFIVRKNPLYTRRRQLLPPIVENKSTIPKTMSTTAAATATPTITTTTITASPTMTLDKDEKSNSHRYMNTAVCHKNCARELNYSRLTRVPTTDNLTECQSPDDDAIQNTSNSFITTTYSPVYNIREIRTVCNSFSSLGIDKKLWDAECNQKTTLPTTQLQNLASMNTAANRHSVAGVTASSINIIREAVNNNPAKGYGSYVYI